MSQSEEERRAICTNIGGYYDGPIYTNELGKMYGSLYKRC